MEVSLHIHVGGGGEVGEVARSVGAVWLAVVSERPSLTCTVLHRQSVIDAANANELRQSIELRTSFVRSFVRSFDQSVWLVGVVVSSLV